jgi:hypothetical protein
VVKAIAGTCKHGQNITDEGMRNLWLVLVIINLAFVGTLVVLLRHTPESTPPPLSIPVQTVTPTPFVQPTRTPSPVASPVPTPSPTFQARTAFQYQQYSDPAYNFTVIYPSDWMLVQDTQVSGNELQVKFGGLFNDNPTSKADIFIGYYRGGLYADWYKMISSLTDNYRLESKDLRNGGLTYSAFIKNIPAGFCRTYVSEVHGGAAVLECTYLKIALAPSEEQLLDNAVRLMAASINIPQSSELSSNQ